MMSAPRLSVLASHEGTTLQAVIDARTQGILQSELGCVISNNRDSGALRRAGAAGIPGFHLSSKTQPGEFELDTAICERLVQQGTELVLLAGYMKKLGPRVLARFQGRILNTHPALLPKFGGQGMYGVHVHRAVLAAAESATGASVHLVDGDYDTGPVLAQSRVVVSSDDTAETLAARVQASERMLLVAVLATVSTEELPFRF